MPTQESAKSCKLLHAATLILATLLSHLPTPCAAQTYIHRSRNYEFVTDLDRADLRDVASHMDAVYDEYARLLSSFGVKNATRNRLYVLKSRDDYVRLLAERGIDATHTGGMFFVRFDGSGLATFLADRPRSQMYQVLQHEGFHQFAYARMGTELPIWANEGLAEYFGHALMVRGKLKTGLTPGARLESLKHAIRADRTVPFHDMVTMSSNEWSDTVRIAPARAEILYTQAWSMAHFLIHAQEGRFASAFEQYLRAAAQGQTASQALETAFGTTNLAAFEEAWKDHTLALEPDPVSLAIERLEFLAQGLGSLHEIDVAVETLAELKHELQRRRFVLRVHAHGIRREFSAEDDSLFEAPRAGPRRVGTMELVPSRKSSHASRRDLPPMIDVTGLGVHIRLHWKRDEAGDLLSEISIK